MNRAPTMPGGWVGGCAAAVLLAAVTLTAAHAQTPVVRFEVERFVVEGDSPLSEVRTREVLQPFTGEHAGVDGLLAAADALERAIQAAGIPFQRVMLPPQTLDDGEVVLRLMVFEVERVEVEGASHHSEANVRRSVPALREGKTPDTDAIARNLAVANRLPWKTTNLTFRESEDSIAGLDARLEVEDRRPWLLWSGLDNTGDASSGRFRWSVGANAGNLFDRDHSVNASYTTSPGHTGQIAQWAVGYGLPVYGLGGMLSAYYVRSDADSGRVLDVLDVSGAGAFAGVAYAQELRRSGNLSHRLSIGIDDRRFENRLVLAGSEVDVAPPPVRSFPLTLTYGAEYAGVDWGADFRVRFARNIESGVDNDDSVYGSNRAGAKAGWDVLRGSATIFWPLPAQWSGRALFEVQKANEPLIAGEQFGLGGAGSVRGFSEREVAGDDGVRGSLELWTPALSDGGTRFVFFADAGRVVNEPAGGLVPRENLVSVGAGMRWNWKEHAALTLDFGAIVNGAITRESGVRGHLNLVVQY